MQSQLALQQPQPPVIQDVAARAQRGIAGWLNSLGAKTAQQVEPFAAMMAAPAGQHGGWRMRPGAAQNTVASVGQPVGTMLMAPLPPAQGSGATAQNGRGQAMARMGSSGGNVAHTNSPNTAGNNGYAADNDGDWQRRNANRNGPGAATASAASAAQPTPPTSLSAPMPVARQAPEDTHASALRDWHASKTNEGLWIGTYGHRDLAASMDAGCGAAAAWRAMDPRLGARQNDPGANDAADAAAWPSQPGPQDMWTQQPPQAPMGLARPMMMPMPLPPSMSPQPQMQPQQQMEQQQQQMVIMPTLDEGTFLMCRPIAFGPSAPPQILPVGPEVPPVAAVPPPPSGAAPPTPDDGNTRVVIQPYPYLPSLFYGQSPALAPGARAMWTAPDGSWIVQ
jgi:hypothetical protein